MPGRSAELEETLELLEPLGPVQARAMFGGWGLYQAGTIFGLVLQRQLYLKTDELTRPDFQAAGGEPFIYDPGHGRKPVAMSYWTPPPDVNDDAHALLPWARRAVQAAQRAAVKKKPVRKVSAKKAPAKKSPAKKTPAKKASAKKTPAKKASATAARSSRPPRRP